MAAARVRGRLAAKHLHEHGDARGTARRGNLRRDRDEPRQRRGVGPAGLHSQRRGREVAAVTELKPINPFLALNELGLMQSVAKVSLQNLRGNEEIMLAHYPFGYGGSAGVLLERAT